MPAAYEGTDIISCLRSKYIIRHSRISYRVSDISLKNITYYEFRGVFTIEEFYGIMKLYLNMLFYWGLLYGTI